MARTTDSPTSRRSGRGSGRGETGAADVDERAVDARAEPPDDALGEQDDEQDDDAEEQEELNTGELIAAALLGAAVGAGLGLLASRYVDTGDLRDRVVSASRQMNRGLRSGLSRGIKQVRRRAPELPDVREYAERARAVFEDALEREVRALKRGARRRRRRFGF
jgi:hypothetical protein